MEEKEVGTKSRSKRRNSEEVVSSEPHSKRQKIDDQVQPFELGHLPCELHQRISFHLPFKTMIRSNEVCRFWKSSMDDVTFWRSFYSQQFGPLSAIHLTLPVPSTLLHTPMGTSPPSLPTPPGVLRWKKRCCVMRGLQCDSEESIPSCVILLGCRTKPRVFDTGYETVEAAILVNDVKLLKATLRHVTTLKVKAGDS